jgi:hypothetical protein
LTQKIPSRTVPTPPALCKLLGLGRLLSGRRNISVR